MSPGVNIPAEPASRAKARGVRFGRPPVPFRPSAPRSYPAACGGRYAGRSRADLRCEPSHDIEAAAKPFRGRKRRRRITAKRLGHRQRR
jgi:hypothetical protein